MPKEILSHSWPLQILDHLAKAVPPQTVGDISLALRLHSSDLLRRTLTAFVGAGLVRVREGTIIWLRNGQPRKRPSRIYAITAKGRRVHKSGKLPPLAIPAPRRPQPLSSTATQMREDLRNKMLAYLKGRRTPAAAAEIIEALGIAHASDLVRELLRTLAAEGAVIMGKAERSLHYRGPNGEKGFRKEVRVYSVKK